MLKRVFKRWNQYKYRFVPWLAQNINESSPRVVSDLADDKIISDTDVEKSLESLLCAFSHNADTQPGVRHKENSKVMLDTLGFQIGRQSSSLPEGGRGVFVTDGVVKQGTVVAMYPGLVYQPFEPVLLVSLANSFLFRCADGLYIDGKDAGLSRMMYNSCSKRDRVFGQMMCDATWLTEEPVNPLAVGQYVNNQSPGYPANVAYQEFDVPASFPTHLRQLLPNTEARLHQDMEQSMPATARLLRVVVLVSLREIVKGEELFSTYFTIVQKNKTDETPS